MRRRALFVVSIYNYHREVFPVVEEFCRGGWEVVVLLGWIGTLADEAQRQYEKLGCRVVRPSPQYSYGDPDLAHVSGRHAEKPQTRPSLMVRMREFVGQLRFTARMKAEVESAVELADPAVVFCGPFHSCGMLDNAVVAWAQREAVPLLCYPVSAYHGQKGAVRARFQNVRVGMVPTNIDARFDWVNRLLAKAFPAWTRSRAGSTIFMWDPLRMLAAKINGLLEPEVWQKPSTCFDVVFVFSEFSRHLLEESGYPMEKVQVAGVPLLDSVVRRLNDDSYRRGLLAAVGLEPGQDFILYNVEPSAEHHYADWDVHWKNFRSMMSVMRGCGLPVVLSLHPLCREADYAFAEKEYGVRIAREHKIYDLYPYCRLSVSFPCSTNLVAETFRKPLVIYDFFDMASESSERAGEYRLPGAMIGHTPEEVAKLIRSSLTVTRDIYSPPQQSASAVMRTRTEEAAARAAG